ncbi:MAG: hypothetical protein L3K19_05040 [Thermoplasmata archaeon]|nr:hypothetical protein [Thermoplasmata archaeon]
MERPRRLEPYERQGQEPTDGGGRVTSETPAPSIPWTFVIVLIVASVVISIVLGYWGATGQLGHPIPGTHHP